MIKSSDPIPYRPNGSYTDAVCVSHQHSLPDAESEKQGLQYTFNLFNGLQAPKILLPQPFLVEVYGAGFTKAHRCKVCIFRLIFH